MTCEFKFWHKNKVCSFRTLNLLQLNPFHIIFPKHIILFANIQCDYICDFLELVCVKKQHKNSYSGRYYGINLFIITFYSRIFSFHGIPLPLRCIKVVFFFFHYGRQKIAIWPELFKNFFHLKRTNY